MSIICKVDGKEFKDEKSLHLALRKYGLNKEKYYHKYFPRKDLLTGEIINFKNKDQYFNSDFNDKHNMRKWLKQQPLHKAREYCEELLIRRKNNKNLIYSPTQVELRSIMAPSIIYYNQIGDYYKLCEKIGLKNKFAHPNNISNKFNSKLSTEDIIYIDTREQNWLKFNSRFEIKTLQYGDYTSSIDADCFIERKSLSDFISTLSIKNLNRFHAEIKRARENNCYIVVMVEEKISNALGFKYLPHISKKIKATSDYIFHNVRDLLQTYDNLQFLFVDGRQEMVRVMQSIFCSNKLYKQVDLQLIYDMRLI